MLTQYHAVHIDETGCPTLAKGQTKKSPGSGPWPALRVPMQTARPSPPSFATAIPTTNPAPICRKLFANYRGYLHADASNVYDALFAQRPDVLEVACWAHARRKFYDVAVASTAATIAHTAVEKINALFAIEAHCTTAAMTPAQRHDYRQQHAQTTGR